MKHDSKLSVETVSSTCVCAVSEDFSSSDGVTSLGIKLRSRTVGPFATTMILVISDGSTQRLQVSGKVTSLIRLLSGQASFDHLDKMHSIEWSKLGPEEPEVVCLDPRFTFRARQIDNEVFKFTLELTHEVNARDSALLRSIPFQLRDGEATYKFHLPFSTPVPSRVLPSRFVIDERDERSFMVIGDKEILDSLGVKCRLYCKDLNTAFPCKIKSVAASRRTFVFSAPHNELPDGKLLYEVQFQVAHNNVSNWEKFGSVTLEKF